MKNCEANVATIKYIPLTFKLGKPNKIPKAAAIKPDTISEPTKPRSGTRKIKLNIAKAPAAMKPAAPKANCPV